MVFSLCFLAFSCAAVDTLFKECWIFCMVPALELLHSFPATDTWLIGGVINQSLWWVCNSAHRGTCKKAHSQEGTLTPTLTHTHTHKGGPFSVLRSCKAQVTKFFPCSKEKTTTVFKIGGVKVWRVMVTSRCTDAHSSFGLGFEIKRN